MAEYRIKGLANQTPPQYKIKGLAPSAPSQQEMEPMQQEQETMGLPGVIKDIYGAGKQALSGLPGALLDLPGQAFGAGRQAINFYPELARGQVPRATRNVWAGLAEAAQKPGELRDYMVRKGLWSQGTPSLRVPESILPRDTAQRVGPEGYEPGDELLRVAPLAIAGGPLARLAGRAIPPVTSRGIVNRISQHKAQRTAQAAQDYSNLFERASNEGVNHAIPLRETAENAPYITRHTTARHNESLNNYLQNPTIENAHWAQSELGSLLRHLDSIDRRGGLTPTQNRVYRAAQDSRRQIQEAMFNENAFGSRPHLARDYAQLSNQYRENVVPYRRLEPITEVEQGTKRPATAVKELRKDDQFMIELSRRYPGLFLHHPWIKRGLGVLAGGALSGIGFTEGKDFFK